LEAFYEKFYHEPHKPTRTKEILYREESYEINNCIYKVSKINDQHKAQLMNYMAATDYKLGLLVNFNSYPKTEIIRLVK